MANELPALVQRVEADISGLETGLKRAAGQVEQFGRDSTRAAEQGARGLERALGGVNDNARLTAGQVQNLGYQLNDIATSLASGASPFQVLAQQGGQVYQALGMGPGGVSGGLRGVKTALLELATPGRVAAGSVALLTGAALIAYNSFDNAQSRIKLGLTGIGQASGATVRDVERIGDEIAATQRISVQAGRDIATAIAATGKVDIGNIAGVGNLTRGFAKVFGVDVEEAGQRLAKIFADPVAGAAELDKRLGNLDARTRNYIQTLSEQGNRQEAVRVLIASAQPVLDQAAASTSVWARAWEAVATAAARAGDAVGRTVSRTVEGPSLQDQAASTERQRAELQERYDRRQGTRDQSGLLISNPLRKIENDAMGRDLADITAKAEDLNEQLRRTAQARAEAFDAAQARDLSKAIDDVFKKLNPEGEGIERVQNQIVALGNALQNSRARGLLPDGEAEKADVSLKALQDRVKSLQEDYDAGGQAAAAALRAANFQASQAGAASYAKGLAEINRQFDEQIRLARLAGDTAKTTQRVGTLEAARVATIGAYATQNRENAIRSTVLAPDEVASTIGAESGGVNSARNNRSSALGAGQFIASTFVNLFRKYDSEQTAIIDQANPVRKEADRVIAALRTNRQVTEKYVDIYLKEIGTELSGAGLENTPRNRQLGYFLGPQGAKTLLRADPNANAAGLLPDAAASNPEVFKRGAASVQDVLDYAQRRTGENNAQARASRERVIAIQAESQAYNQSAAEQERLRTVQEALTASRERGEDLGNRFKTAQDLIKASSAELTPELTAQRDALLKLADARAAASSNALSSRFQQDQQLARDALGRTSDDQSAFQQARAYATPGSADFKGYYDGIRDLQGLTSVKSDTSSFLKDLNSDLIRGTSLAGGMLNAVNRLLAKVTDRFIDSAVSGIFGSLFGGKDGASGAGGIFSAVSKFFAGGFAEGGTVPAGMFAVVGERGPEVLGPSAVPRVVTPNEALSPISAAVPAISNSSGPQSLALSVDVSGARGNQEIMTMVQAGVAAGMAQVQSNIGRNINGIVAEGRRRYRPA